MVNVVSSFPLLPLSMSLMEGVWQVSQTRSTLDDIAHSSPRLKLATSPNVEGKSRRVYSRNTSSTIVTCTASVGASVPSLLSLLPVVVLS